MIPDDNFMVDKLAHELDCQYTLNLAQGVLNGFQVGFYTLGEALGRLSMIGDIADDVLLCAGWDHLDLRIGELG